MKFIDRLLDGLLVAVAFLGIVSTSAQERRTATAVPTVVNGFIVAITVTDGGAGYPKPPAVTIVGGEGTGATAIATVLNGSVDKIIVENAGSGYTGSPSIIVAPPPDPFSDALVAFYPFNGNAIDESGNGFHATIHEASLTTDRHGEQARAYFFNGVSSYISRETPTLDLSLPEFSISLWFKPIGNTRPDNILFNSVPHNGIDFDFDVNGIRYWVGPGNGPWEIPGFYGTKTDYHDGRWYFLLFTKNTNVYSLYINGLIDRSTESEILFNATAGFYIGACSCGGGSAPGQFFSGAIDDVRIYSRALPPAEVLDLFKFEAPLLPSVGIRIKTVEVTMYVVPGKSYQLQSSFDLASWINVGDSFVADSAEVTQDFLVQENGQYFRIRNAP